MEKTTNANHATNHAHNVQEEAIHNAKNVLITIYSQDKHAIQDVYHPNSLMPKINARTAPNNVLNVHHCRNAVNVRMDSSSLISINKQKC